MSYAFSDVDTPEEILVLFNKHLDRIQALEKRVAVLETPKPEKTPKARKDKT